MSFLGKSKKILEKGVMSPFSNPLISGYLKLVGAGSTGIIGIPLALAILQIRNKNRLAREAAAVAQQKKNLNRKRLGYAGAAIVPPTLYGWSQMISNADEANQNKLQNNFPVNPTPQSVNYAATTVNKKNM